MQEQIISIEAADTVHAFDGKFFNFFRGAALNIMDVSCFTSGPVLTILAARYRLFTFSSKDSSK